MTGNEEDGLKNLKAELTALKASFKELRNKMKDDFTLTLSFTFKK